MPLLYRFRNIRWRFLEFWVIKVSFKVIESGTVKRDRTIAHQSAIVIIALSRTIIDLGLHVFDVE